VGVGAGCAWGTAELPAGCLQPGVQSWQLLDTVQEKRQLVEQRSE